MPSTPLPDAARQNWVDAHAPEGLKPWLKLGRFDRPIGIWLLLLPGWQGIGLALVEYRQSPDFYHLWLFVAFGLGACLMRAAGCAFNDIVDRDIDAQVSRTAGRPIPSGRISVSQASMFVGGCCLVSLSILLTLGPIAIGLGVASLVLVGAYPFMKRITWWPQAWLGLTFNWGALMGYAAAGGFALAAGIFDDFGVLARVVYSGVWLWLAGVFWTLGYDTVYALQDVEDDAMVGVKSSARRLGRSVRLGVGLFYAAALAFAALAGTFASLGPVFYLGLLAFGAHLAWQVYRLRLDDAALALKLFRSNREAGMILLAAILMGAIVPAGLAF